MSAKTLILAVGLTCCAPSPIAWAQSASSESEQQAVSELDEVVVQGVRRDPRRDDTSSRIVVGQEELTRFGDTSLTEAMKRLPGVTVGPAQAGRAGGISLRGMGEGYTQILIDGQKAPTGFDLESLTPEMVASIEILRSPTADIRAEGTAGSINIILTRGANRDSTTAALVWETTNGRDMVNASWRGTRQVENLTRALAVNLRRREVRADDTAVWRETDSSGTTDALRTLVSAIDAVRTNLTLTPSVQVDLANGDRLGLHGAIDVSRLDRSGVEDWRTIIGSPLERTALRQDLTIDLSKLNLGLDWVRTFQDGAVLTSKATLGGNRETYRFDEQGYDDNGRQTLDDRTRARTRVLGLTASSKYAFGPTGAHTYEIGWETALDKRRDRRVQDLGPVGGTPGTIDDQTFDIDIRRLAVYAQDEIQLNPTLSMYFGLRWEGVETTSDSVAYPDLRRRDTLLSPTFHSVWTLPGAARRQIRLAANRTFKLPPISSLTPRPYTSSNNTPLAPDEQGNPALRPESATGFDLAFEQYWDAGARISFGTFVRRIDGVVRSETRLLNGRWVASPFNGGAATVWGLETDARFNLNQVLALVLPGAPDVALRFNATYSDSSVADVRGPDDRIPGQIPFSATFGGDYVVRPGWTVGASYSHRSESTIQIAATQRRQVSSADDLELYSLWSLNPLTSLRLSGSSLTARDARSSNWRSDRQSLLNLEKRNHSAPVFRIQLEREF
ncbi:TonB-dependent receptor domain-containing protein [Brevundimonas sp.]|uniref:TonB-dependent receptor plug domain-containing protein n=1 Tax=Brevundimonas sp. TaxID=1871086 RepID=UPI0028B03B89|nr:TonB-dependent receptor [Brevundimonas sp.]